MTTVIVGVPGVVIVLAAGALVKLAADSRSMHVAAGLAGGRLGASLVATDRRYARFTFTTRLFRFVDDVEFHDRPDAGEISVRSASRVGHGDLNANRNRVESIRSLLASGR